MSSPLLSHLDFRAATQAQQCSTAGIGFLALLWYRHYGWSDGSYNWDANGGTQVGNGWNFKLVFSG